MMLDNSQFLKKGSSLKAGTYTIRNALGQGSFGITYLAETSVQAKIGSADTEMTAIVAIKEFFMSDVNNRNIDSSIEGTKGNVFSSYLRKFRKEAENLSKLSHKGIVRVFDVFDQNNTTYYVMDFIDGETLDEYIARKGRIPEYEAIEIINEVGKALAYMHSMNMLHLDIKPKNIMRSIAGRYTLIDFGLSKQFTEDGEPESSTSIGLGTAGYAPIEQASYHQDGSFPATLDVYALGATLFKILTGKRPPEATIILNEGFPREDLLSLGVSVKLIDAIEKAMAPLRKNRCQTVEEFLELTGNISEPDRHITPSQDEKTIVATDISPKANVTPTPVVPPRTKTVPKPKIKPGISTAKTDGSDKDGKSKSSMKWIIGAIAAVLIIIFALANSGNSEYEYYDGDSTYEENIYDLIADSVAEVYGPYYDSIVAK